MKKVFTILLIMFCMFSVKQVDAQLIDAFTKAQNIVKSLSTKGTKIENYKTLIDETKNTYVLVEELFCLKQSTNVYVAFAKDNLNSCYLAVKYQDYYTMYNSLINSVSMLITTLQSILVSVSSTVDGDGNQGDKFVMDAINTLQNLQESINELMDVMYGLQYSVEKKVENRIRRDYVTSSEYQYGQYQIVVD